MMMTNRLRTLLDVARPTKKPELPHRKRAPGKRGAHLPVPFMMRTSGDNVTKELPREGIVHHPTPHEVHCWSGRRIGFRSASNLSLALTSWGWFIRTIQINISVLKKNVLNGVLTEQLPRWNGVMFWLARPVSVLACCKRQLSCLFNIHWVHVIYIATMLIRPWVQLMGKSAWYGVNKSEV